MTALQGTFMFATWWGGTPVGEYFLPHSAPKFRRFSAPAIDCILEQD
jgi:hypothetical protein